MLAASCDPAPAPVLLGIYGSFQLWLILHCFKYSMLKFNIQVHVELEELRMDAEEGVSWAETARWIKFEEDVEEGCGKWGRPHISALAFHSLVEVQRGLEKGQ